jgi:15-cis-phytoene synthase
MSALDESLVNRAAPAGSMRYFSTLYAPVDKRDVLRALYVIDAEVRESAQNVNHDVAHTRLQWWRAEVDRLINGVAQHPATRLLSEQSRQERQGFANLHECLVAADMDLARLTYSNARELQAYCARSGGAVLELVAAELADPPLKDAQRALANRIGVGLRQTEMLRDLRQDAYAGRVYLPLDELATHGLTEIDLRAAETPAAVKSALRPFAARAEANLAQACDLRDAALRPICVLAALHRRLLDRIAARGYDVGAERIELGPFEKPWIAWRAARKSG